MITPLLYHAPSQTQATIPPPTTGSNNNGNNNNANNANQGTNTNTGSKHGGGDSDTDNTGTGDSDTSSDTGSSSTHACKHGNDKTGYADSHSHKVHADPDTDESLDPTRPSVQSKKIH